MSRPPWQCSFASYQNLAAGDALQLLLEPSDQDVVIRLDFASFYWGAPSSVASNSAVIVVGGAVSSAGNPTVVAYDSGVTGSDNPIYEYFSPRYVFEAIAPNDDPVVFAAIANTSFSQSVDVCASGIVLAGSPQFAVSTNPA